MLFLLSGHPEICYQVWLLLLVLIWGYHFNSWIYHSLLSLPRKFKTSFLHIAMAHMWDLATILILYTTVFFFIIYRGECERMLSFDWHHPLYSSLSSDCCISCTIKRKTFWLNFFFLSVSWLGPDALYHWLSSPSVIWIWGVIMSYYDLDTLLPDSKEQNKEVSIFKNHEFMLTFVGHI
jgi:hypothetical protein